MSNATSQVVDSASFVMPTGMSLARSTYAASDENPYKLTVGDFTFAGDSPEECVERLVKELNSLSLIRKIVPPLLTF